MIEAILLWASILALVVTELAGFLLRRYGFITISETSRIQPRLRLSVAALIVVTFLWWLVHSMPR
ncbi:MAG TPA: hypothetical protein VI172_04020 [Candidatus Dormibacteraeota bacterium]|jgi:hypothetical protein